LAGLWRFAKGDNHCLLTFFPTLVNVLVEPQSAERPLRDLMRLYQATTWQEMRHLRF
jgi:ABC-type nitrate/sulfonate/bicarbonate transport system permease component